MIYAAVEICIERHGKDAVLKWIVFTSHTLECDTVTCRTLHIRRKWKNQYIFFVVAVKKFCVNSLQQQLMPIEKFLFVNKMFHSLNKNRKRERERKSEILFIEITKLNLHFIVRRNFYAPEFAVGSQHGMGVECLCTRTGNTPMASLVAFTTKLRPVPSHIQFSHSFHTSHISSGRQSTAFSFIRPIRLEQFASNLNIKLFPCTQRVHHSQFAMHFAMVAIQALRQCAHAMNNFHLLRFWMISPAQSLPLPLALSPSLVVTFLF